MATGAGLFSEQLPNWKGVLGLGFGMAMELSHFVLQLWKSLWRRLHEVTGVRAGALNWFSFLQPLMANPEHRPGESDQYF